MERKTVRKGSNMFQIILIIILTLLVLIGMYIAVTDNNIGIGPRIQSSSSVYFVELPIGSGEESPPKSQMSKVIAINLDP